MTGVGEFASTCRCQDQSVPTLISITSYFQFSINLLSGQRQRICTNCNIFPGQIEGERTIKRMGNLEAIPFFRPIFQNL